MFFENVEVNISRHIKGKTDRGYSTFVFMLSVLFKAQERPWHWLFIVDITNVLTHLQGQFRNKMDSASPTEVIFQCFRQIL